MKLRPVILAGGEGKRLAPLSTPECPKPFLALPDGQSLMEKTCRRLDHPDFLPPILIGNAKDRYALLNHVRAAGVEPAAILLEDRPHNTALAVALGVLYAQRGYDSNEILAFLPADHVIEQKEAWQRALVQAASLAHEQQCLALLGMSFSTFSPELGYVAIAEGKVQSFIEKPISRDKLDESMHWFANSGQFLGTSRAFSQILAQFSPIIWEISQNLMKNCHKQWEYEYLSPLNDAFTLQSFDKEVLEKLKNLAACPAECGWRDLGRLDDWYEYTKIPMKHQNINQNRVDRPWGYYHPLEQTQEYSAKRLFVFPGCRLSRQRHFYRSEHWTVEQGTAYVERDHEKFTLGIYESIKIPPASWHRLVNPTGEMLIIKEIQYGISDETDIERVEDDYGRI